MQAEPANTGFPWCNTMKIFKECSLHHIGEMKENGVNAGKMGVTLGGKMVLAHEVGFRILTFVLAYAII